MDKTAYLIHKGNVEVNKSLVEKVLDLVPSGTHLFAYHETPYTLHCDSDAKALTKHKICCSVCGKEFWVNVRWEVLVFVPASTVAKAHECKDEAAFAALRRRTTKTDQWTWVGIANLGIWGLVLGWIGWSPPELMWLQGTSVLLIFAAIAVYVTRKVFIRRKRIGILPWIGNWSNGDAAHMAGMPGVLLRRFPVKIGVVSDDGEHIVTTVRGRVTKEIMGKLEWGGEQDFTYTDTWLFDDHYVTKVSEQAMFQREKNELGA